VTVIKNTLLPGPDKGTTELFTGRLTLIIPDIACTNGVIHGIGGVVIPR
jgi:uncharacterized surface protein with fasciclin (FAS1) repeats